MSKWRDSFGKAQGNIERRMELAARNTALELFTRVILRTPVRDGRARGSWGVAIGQPQPGPHDSPDKQGSRALSQAQAEAAALKLGERVLMVSNLVYMPPLENGSSTQAPAGMVKVTVEEYPQIVKAAIEGARRS